MSREYYLPAKYFQVASELFFCVLYNNMVDDDVYCEQVHHLNSGFSQNSSSVRLAPVRTERCRRKWPNNFSNLFINSDGR